MLNHEIAKCHQVSTSCKPELRNLKVLVVHNENSAKESAAKLFEKICFKLNGFDLQPQLVDASSLENPDEFRAALDTSDSADILIIAMEGTRRFGRSIELWLRLCARTKAAVGFSQDVSELVMVASSARAIQASESVLRQLPFWALTEK